MLGYPGGFRALELPDKSDINAIGTPVGGAFFRVRRLRSPLLMLTPRTGSHPRPSGPIKYVTMLVPRAQQDDLLQPHTLPLPMKLPMPLLLPMPPPLSSTDCLPAAHSLNRGCARGCARSCAGHGPTGAGCAPDRTR